MDKKLKKDNDSLLTNRFTPGENQYLNDKSEVSPSDFILGENVKSVKEDHDDGEEYTFLYWQ
ncbi:hypothetical protein [Aneurinibacillus danicus]|jgi:hypothetical protein|uniref:Uncharacterized protein n=1 Tax=Aneurinibacillus danicus TaxID=267746 RepID=A0A511VHW4_9BACL|nr:hypothetical protein [Aneurinibacillus danicus]GEN36762.1 hypothetical protein ADA01nite_42220 [Aneurinibacillus danicus]